MSENSPVSLIRDRRLQALVAAALLAFVLGFVAIPDKDAITLVSKCGYWLVLLGFVGFVVSTVATFKSELVGWEWRRVDWLSVAIVGVGGLVLLVHEEFGFKIVMDEIMLLGTSMSMHFDKTVLTPMRGNDVQGAFVILDGMMDKRPLFFPFLVSVVHDLSGYRPENAFVLNAGLVFVFLGLVFVLGRKLAGRAAGWLGVALFAGLPLLGHNATGGGFELLNLTMLAATVLLGERWAARRDGASLTAFCYAALLLAQVRYESVVYLLPVAGLVLWGWWRERRPVLTWAVVVAPLLLVHSPLQHRIFDLRSSSWELASQPGFTEPFSWRYIPDNLVHAVNYFFGAASEQPNSLVLSALGWLAVPFFVLLLLKRLRAQEESTPASIVTAWFALGFALHFALLMCYFWGRFDDVVIRRLSLPTHLGLVLALFAVLPQFAKPAVMRALLLVALFGAITRGVPSMAAHAYSQEYLPGREIAWRREFIKEQRRSDFLVIDNDSPFWVSHRISATPVGGAVRRRDLVVFHLKNRTFSDVFVFQRLNVDPDTGATTYRTGDDLGPAFVLETVREERLQALTISRLSRVKEIRDGAVSLTAPDGRTHVVPKDPKAVEKARQQFLENFIKQLP